ncbi:hypothetical protein F3Y22_tig00113123pilonHSYRG00049 [Hibiscus syriacus]|uniref:Uncharacterized protein n=1 Tax=Hibiscus syriacus TaxID=106335 RepID=A0A6A2WQD4_HIBSY|nr:hypothetical protein F3Y22_tig00113123pilonHSYRG00049 [Hibiscus syriacus]
MTSKEGEPVDSTIDIPETEKSEFIKKKSQEFKSAMDGFRNQGGGLSSQRTKPLIQRVPPFLLNMKEGFNKCFEPRLVSLGPLHHGDPRFQRAEVSNLQFAAFFALEDKTTDNNLFGKIKAETKDLRKCYKPDDKKLAWILFIDGCVVLCTVNCGMEGEFDKLNTKPDLLVFARKSNSLQSPPVSTSRNAVKGPDTDDYAHLLEWLRAKHLIGDKVKRESSMIGKMLLSCGDSRRRRKTFRSVKELTESGIYVKPTPTINLKNIYFFCKDFKNEFEITTHLCFLDFLIDTAEDVKELRVMGMLHNYLGSDEEVADLFNKMSRDLVPDQQWYSEVVHDIHKYCNNPWTAALAHAYYTHFSSSWSILAFLGVSIGLLFSATQVYFSLPQNRQQNQ